MKGGARVSEGARVTCPIAQPMVLLYALKPRLKVQSLHRIYLHEMVRVGVRVRVR